MRWVAFVVVVVLASVAHAQLQVRRSNTTSMVSCDRRGVIRCTYFQPFTVVDRGSAAGYGGTGDAYGFAAAGAPLVDDAAHDSAPFYAWDLPDGQVLDVVGAEAVGGLGSAYHFGSDYAGNEKTYNAGVMVFSGAQSAAAGLRFVVGTSTLSNSQATALASMYYGTWAAAVGTNAFGFHSPGPLQFIAWWDVSTPNVVKGYVDLNMWWFQHGSVGDVHTEGSPNLVQAVAFTIFPGENWLDGGTLDSDAIVTAIHSLEDTYTTLQTNMMDKLTEWFGTPEGDPATLTLDDHPVSSWSSYAGETGSLPDAPAAVSDGFTAPTLPTDIPSSEGVPDWSFTLDTSGWHLGSFYFGSMLGGGSLHINPDVSAFEPYRIGIRSLLLVFFTISGMGRVWSELRRH